MKAKTKRVVTALLAVVMLLTTLLPLTASAADVTMDLNNCHVSWDYTLTDEEGNTFSAAYGLRAADDIYFNKGFSPYLSRMHDYTAKRSGLTGNKSDWVYGKDYVYCFCIERGIPLPDNTEYAGSADASHGDKYKRLTENQKDLLKLALTYGYPNRVGLQTSKDANACYAATQLIVWQITMGFRSSATELNDKTYPMSGYSGTMTEQYTRNKYLKVYYDAILSDMARHYTRPSFTAYTASAAKTFEMDYSGGRYTVTLTDTNRVLQNYAVTVSGGASVSVNGNTLTVSSVKPLNDEVTVKLNRRVPSTDMSTGFLIWSVPGKENANQDMVSGVPADNDPVPAYLKVRTAAGSAKIVKVSEDGKVHVTTVDEFLAAIAPDTTIYLEAGTYDLSTAEGYGVSGTERYHWELRFDGPSLVITGVDGLTIEGAGAESVTIAAVPRYADVLSFERCAGLTLRGFTAGHTEEKGACTGGVLYFDLCDDAVIDGCALFGCGIMGITAGSCADMNVSNTEIYDCEYGAVTLNDSNAVFDNCDIHDNGGPDFQLYGSTAIVDGKEQTA